MKIYILKLANVHSNVDRLIDVAVSDNLDKLKAWEKEQRAEKPYISEDEHSDGYGRVHGYQLAYKKGSPLQWFNPPEMGWGGIGTYEVDLKELDNLSFGITKV